MSTAQPSPPKLTPEQAHQLVAEQAKKNAPYKWDVMADFLCRHHGVKDLCFVSPFRTIEAWKLMQDVVLGVKLGSPEQTSIQYDLSNGDAESQVVKLLLQPGPACTFLDSPLPAKPLPHPGQPGKTLERDLDMVNVWRITCKHVASSVPLYQGARLNFYHNGMPRKTLQAEDEMRAATGNIRGEFLEIPPSTRVEGVDLNSVPLQHQQFGAVNKTFMQTMALVTDANLFNGIIDIPVDVCLAAGLKMNAAADTQAVMANPPDATEDELAQAFGKIKIESEEQRTNMEQTFKAERSKRWAEEVGDKTPIHSYRAIPCNHVLAWCMRSADYAAKAKLEYQVFEFIPAKDNAARLPHALHTLYFFVADCHFNTMVNEFRATWMSLVDTRPLSSIGIELLPKLVDRARYYPNIDPSVNRVCGSTVLLTYVSYCVRPKLSAAQLASLSPTLHPDFRPSGDWVSDSIADEMLADALRSKKE